MVEMSEVVLESRSILRRCGMQMYIFVHLYTFALQKIPDLWDVHPGYISSTSRVHLEYI